jgi:hypothetical protein
VLRNIEYESWNIEAPRCRNARPTAPTRIIGSDSPDGKGSGRQGSRGGGRRRGSRTTPRGRKNVAHRVVKGLSEDIALRSCPRTVYLLHPLPSLPPSPRRRRSPPALWEPPMYQRSNVSSASLLLWPFRALYGRNFLRSNVRAQWRKASSAAARGIPSADDMRERSIII